MTLAENRDVACFLVTKHSWKGKYKRIFSIGTTAISTYNPQSLEVTNQWTYSDFHSIKPSSRPGSVPGEFEIHMKNNKKKADHMRFSSDYTPDILTQALRYRHLFAAPLPDRLKVNGYKQHWSDERQSVTLEVSEASLNQLNQQGKLVAEYNFKDIQEFIKVSDCPGGFCIVYGDQRRLHLFACQGCDDLLQATNTASYHGIGVGIKLSREPFTLRQFVVGRLGRCGSDLQITSFVEFTVYKLSPRHSNPVRRLLCLSETCVLERDPASYMVVCVRSLMDVHCLVRDENNPQLFQIEFETGQVRSYTATERDNILASLLDGVRASGNNNVHVRMNGSDRGLRITPYNVVLDEDGESQLIRHLALPPLGMKRLEQLRRFNANVPYSGLLYSTTQEGFFTENKEKLIIACLQSLMSGSGEVDSVSVEELEAEFQALHRLFASKAGFHAFTAVPGLREKLGARIVRSLKRKNDAVDHAAVDMLCALLQPMHSGYELRQEQMNKSSLLASKAFLEHLLDVIDSHVAHGTGALVIASLLDFLTYSLCAPYSETTHGDQFDQLLELVAAKGRVFYKLFQFASMTIVKGAGMVMRAIIEESNIETSSRMQELALVEGALLKHLHLALFTESKDIRMLTNRQLSRHLLALWVTGNDPALQLLARCLPKGLLNYLESKDDVPVTEEELLLIRNNLQHAQMEENAQKPGAVTQQLLEMQRAVEKQLDTVLQHWRLRQKLTFLKKDERNQRPVVLRKRRQRVKASANWKLFFYQFSKDHSKSDLIWNHKTREELREAFENELRSLATDKELTVSVSISWNHTEFEIRYPSLADEVRIGDYFLRNLLEEDNHSDNPTPIHQPYEFFNEVYHHFLLNSKPEMRCLCLQALAVTYSRHYEQIGAFTDTKYIVAMLEKCMDPTERDHLLVLLSKLIFNKQNVRDVINANGVAIFVDLVTLAHLHVSRAHVYTQTNVIEAAPDMTREGAKEWYYSDKDGSRQGPISLQELKSLFDAGTIDDRTRCWAQGLEGWRPIRAVPQLRWTLVSKSHGMMNETDLAILILNMLIRMCEYFPSRDVDDCVVRPVPKVKKHLSQAGYLPHIVQLLLTFDPTIVEKSATLIFMIMQDNPFISRLYLTGVFFFILMYTGSNVLPIARFLHYTHLKQAFRSEVPKSDIVRCSVLSPNLPEATVYYLENYGPEKYAEVFLGEYDNPEVIWNTEMRRQMIEKLAAHVGDFSQRLPSNIKAIYQYCPIPEIVYPQLDDEIFCHIYYLRHLCDLHRFPTWEIRDPVIFLKACLTAWHEEIERKPPAMSVEEACEVLKLNIEEAGSNEATIRRAYFKLAQQYHPDKNPEGREMFEMINSAYEFLCSKASKTAVGPDSARIVLCLRAQSIVYSRHMEELAPYKYAGYPQLIKTIRLETQDEMLFSKGVPLLAAAAELCYYTLACSSLNAEQLRRETGLEALEEAFNRCVSVLGLSSKSDDLAVQVCLHTCRCFSTAAQFESCREKLSQMAQVFVDVCRVLYFRHLVKLSSGASECVTSFAVCTLLQTQLFQAGVLWHLIPNLFQYDFTLDEGGVSKSENTNQQELQNKLARVSCQALASLAGYVVGCPENDGVQNSLRAMLTPYVVRLMASKTPDIVLKTLNSNTENPYLIWDNGTRVELLEFVEIQRTSTDRSSDLFGAEFKFSAYEKELIIGDIFVRIYNEQPTFQLEQPKQFCADLLDFLNAQIQYLHSLVSLSHVSNGFEQSVGNGTEERLKNVEMALEALRNVIKANPGLEMLCIGHFKLLFSYFRVDQHPKLQMRALEVISLAAANQECVSDIAASSSVVYLFLLMASLSQCSSVVISTLFTLSSNGQIVKDALELGGLVYILDLFCNHDDGDVRSGAAELIGKMQSDKLSGPRWTRSLLLFLPPIFSEAARDSPKMCVQVFDGTTENPELIWNDVTRNRVKQIVKKEAMRTYQLQKDNPVYLWKAPENFKCAYEDVVSGEFVVGGVFIRLFMSNPSWVLRQPRQFMTELIETTLEQMRSSKPDGDRLESLSTALVLLLKHHTNLSDQVPAQGYLPQICDVMNTKDEKVARASLLIFQQLTENQRCVESLASLECLTGVQSAMKLRPDLLHVAATGLHSLFNKDSTVLVEQALKCKLIDYLLTLLGSSLPDVENPQAVKAEIVKALKAMAINLEFGQQVSEILNNSRTWKEFKDQKHDLFIQSAPQIQALTAGSGVAGYLTQGMSYNQSQVVPPPP